MGIQGSGKGTQGQMLAEKFGYVFFEAGGMFREEIASGSELGKKIDKIINVRGELVPEKITRELVERNLRAIPKDEGIIIDGFPRTRTQLVDLKEILRKIGKNNFIVFHVKISDEEALKRLSKRQVCVQCKAADHQEKANVCSKCGGSLSRRKDDSREKVLKRLTWSHQETDPVIWELKKNGVLREINGEQAVTKVFDDILKSLVGNEWSTA